MKYKPPELTERQYHFATATFLVVASFTTYIVAAAGWYLIQPNSGGFIDLLVIFDSAWYRLTIEQGYMNEPFQSGSPTGQANWAFFPLYPLSVSIFKYITGLSTNHAGILISNLFLLSSMYISFKYYSETRDESSIIVIGILLAFFPYSFYFSTLYTESLFVLLTVISFYLLHHEKWLWCGVTGALLSATRAVGVLFAGVLLLRLFSDYYSRGFTSREMVVQLFYDENRVLAIGLVPLGIGLYMLYLYFRVGDPLAFMHVQVAWGREFGNPINTLIQGLLGKKWSVDIISIYLSLWSSAGLLCGLYLLIYRRYTEAMFLLGTILIPLSSGLQSMPRYIIGNPFFIFALSDIINRLGKTKWIILTTLASSNIPLLFLWFNGNGLVA